MFRRNRSMIYMMCIFSVVMLSACGKSNTIEATKDMQEMTTMSGLEGSSAIQTATVAQTVQQEKNAVMNEVEEEVKEIVLSDMQSELQNVSEVEESFISTSKVLSQVFVDVFSDYDKNVKWMYYPTDLDHDDIEEMLVAIYLDEDTQGNGGDAFFGDIWFVDEEGIGTKLVEQADLFKSVTKQTIGMETHVLLTYLPSAVNSDGIIFTYRNNEVHIFELEAGAKSFEEDQSLTLWKEDYSFSCMKDGNEEIWTGHTWMPFTYHFVNGEYIPYGVQNYSLGQVQWFGTLNEADWGEKEAYQFQYREDGKLIVSLRDVSEPDTTYYYTYFYVLDSSKRAWKLVQNTEGIYR